MANSVIRIILLISACGAFGGLVCGLSATSRYRLRMPWTGRQIEIGFLGDIFVGTAAGNAVFFFAASLFNVKLDGMTSDGATPVADHMRIMTLATLSGFAGIRALSAMSSKVLEKITSLDERMDQIEKSEKISEILRQADMVLDQNPGQAMALYSQVISIVPANRRAMIGKSKALRRMARLKEAIEILTEIIKDDSKAEQALYNRACYKNLSGYPREEILDDLKKAIAQLPFYRQKALIDPDFKSLLEDEEFKKVVQS